MEPSTATGEVGTAPPGGRAGCGGRRRRRRRRDRGFTLAVLAIVIAVMGIAVGVAMPSWSTAIRREKEEELIFRGLQYAEGIRLFQRRFGRYPSSLEELERVRPRFLRQAWADPFSRDGAWVAVRLAPGGGRGPGADPDPGQGPGGASQGPRGRGREPRLARGVLGGDATDAPETVQGTPIVGVRSRADAPGASRSAAKSFFGSRDIRQWEFTADLLTGNAAGRGRGNRPAGGPGIGMGGGVVSGSGGVPTGAQIPRAAWIGRPFRFEMPGGGAGVDTGLEPSDLGGDGGAARPRPARGPGGMPQQLLDEDEGDGDGDGGPGDGGR